MMIEDLQRLRGIAYKEINHQKGVVWLDWVTARAEWSDQLRKHGTQLLAVAEAAKTVKCTDPPGCGKCPPCKLLTELAKLEAV